MGKLSIRQNPKLFIGFAIGLFFLLVILLAVFFPSVGIRDIVNYDQRVELLDTGREGAKQVLKEAVVKFVNDSLGMTNGEIIVRDGSYSDVKVGDNENSASFIIDLPELKRSYGVSYSYFDDNPDKVEPSAMSIYCLSDEKQLYGSFHDCQGTYFNYYQQMARNNPISQYLPYSEEAEFDLLSINSVDSEGRPVIILKTAYRLPYDASEAQFVIDSQIVKVREWIVSKSLNPDDYKIQFVR